MRNIKDLPAWERLLKKIVWKQLGEIKNKNILDFESGESITSNYFAEFNRVVAIEPSEDMLKDAWTDHRNYWYSSYFIRIKKLYPYSRGIS